MDATIGQPGAALENKAGDERLMRLLREEPWSVRFFQAVRLLERLHPERMPVGYFVSPQDEVVRFSSRTSLNFPASEVHSFNENAAGPHRMEVNFLGLTTINGPLPHPYAEHMLERIRARDHAPGEFFDIFNHRFVSLFYRSWKKYRFFIAYELDGVRAQAEESAHTGEDAVTASLYSLLGLGTGGLRHRAVVADEATLYYAGLLGRGVPTAQALRQLLEDFFEVPVRIEEFTGSWNLLPQEDLTCLRDAGGQPECLGTGAIVGDAVWDQQGTVTVRLGPMPLRQYMDFLPGGAAALQLAAWLRRFGRGEFDFAVRLVLARDQVPGVLLTEAESGMGRLGFASWLKNRPFLEDADDALYRVQ
ncbi:MAG TPA: type VI secretion system baseplate subunit TssG [Acidobacteriaceae bacterium]